MQVPYTSAIHGHGKLFNQKLFSDKLFKHKEIVQRRNGIFRNRERLCSQEEKLHVAKQRNCSETENLLRYKEAGLKTLKIMTKYNLCTMRKTNSLPDGSLSCNRERAKQKRETVCQELSRKRERFQYERNRLRIF